MSRIDTIDLGKAWKVFPLMLATIPLRFALHCYVAYLSWPYFFGTNLEILPQAVLLTAGLWAGTFLTQLSFLPLISLRRRLLLAVNPEFADRLELDRQRALSKQRAQVLSGAANARRLARRIPPAFFHLLVVLWIASYALPQLFINGSAIALCEFALLLVFCDTAISIVANPILFTDLRRRFGPEDDSDDRRPTEKRGGGLWQFIKEAQEEQALSFARHDLELETSLSAQAYLERGKEYLESYRAVPAIDDFSQSILLDQGSAAAFEARADAYQSLGLIYLARNDLMEAARIFAEAADQRSHERIAEKQKMLGAASNPKAAISSAGEALALMANLIEPNKRTAMRKIRMDNIQKDFQSGRQTASIYRRQAELLLMEGEYERALESCNKALDLSSEDAEAYRMRAQVLVQMERIEDALRDYDRAITLNAADEDSYRGRARINLVFGANEAVVRDCTHALSFSKNYELSLLRGSALVALARYEDALVDLTNAITSLEHCISVWNALLLPPCRRIARLLREPLCEAYEQRAIAFDGIGNVDKAALDLVRAHELKGKTYGT